MKRFLVSILVPAAAAIAVVGSGFSVWYFGDKQVETKTDASTGVKNMLHIGTFEGMSTNFKLHFDQTAEGRNKALKLKGIADPSTEALAGLEAEGIKLTDESGISSTIKYVSSTAGNVVDSGTFGIAPDDITVAVKITTTFTVKGALANWLVVNKVEGVTSTELPSETPTGTADKVFTYAWDRSGATKQTELNLLTGISFGYAAITNQYNGKTDVVEAAKRAGFPTCEPLNDAEYDVMYAAINDLTDAVTIKTVAELYKVVA